MDTHWEDHRQSLQQLLPESVHWAHVRARDLLHEGRAWLAELRRGVAQQLHGSPALRRTLELKDELWAHWHWSAYAPLQDDTRVPMASGWDSRHALALLELARSLRDHGRGGGTAAEVLPPVTAALCLAQLALFLKPGGVRLRDVSLSPFMVVRGEWHRIFTAAFVHFDAAHLLTNLAAALPDCLFLESTRGSAALAADLLLLCCLSGGLHVALSGAQARLFVSRRQYFSLVTLGFSGVAFALKVWAGCQRGGEARVLGAPVPARFAWLPALVLTHLVVPEASFAAHVAGVCAGIARAYVVEPAIVWLRGGSCPGPGSASTGGSQATSSGSHGCRQAADGHGGAPLQEPPSPPPQQLEHSSSAVRSQQQPLDWRQLHRERWLQQQQQQQPQQVEERLSAPRASSHGGEAAAAGGAGSVPSGAGRGAGVLWEGALQLALAAAVAGAYCLLSSGQGPGTARGASARSSDGGGRLTQFLSPSWWH